MSTTESRWALWMRNGRLSFLAWLLMLCIYAGFRFAGIEDTVVTNALIAFTGLLVGNLGIAQGQRQARTEQRAAQSVRRIDQLEEDSATTQIRADRSEARETEWSKHRDHAGDDDA